MTEQNTTLPSRSDIPEAETWDVAAIYASDDDWHEDFEKVEALLPDMQAYEGRLHESAETLYEALQLQDQIAMTLEKVYVYAHLNADVDTTNSHYQGLHDQAVFLATKASSQLSFVVPEILSIPEEILTQFIQSHDGLSLYDHAIEEINQERPHVLQANEEALLAQASDMAGSSANTFGMLNNADLSFPSVTNAQGEEIEVTHGRYIQLLQSDDRQLRENAFHALHDTYDAFKNTFASTLSGQVKKNNFFAHVHHYDSARQAALHANQIPEKVYDQLITTVHDYLPLLHRYIRVRKQALQLDDLHLYDMYTPLVKDVDMSYSFEQAQDIVLNGLKPLGDDYLDIIRKGYHNRWIDIHENKGKRSGAYSSGAYNTMPYILLNWQDSIENVFTLAHELGHSVHSYYTKNQQPYPYADYSIFVAEVASTCNEQLLNQYLLDQSNDKKERMYLLNHMLEGFRGTIFRQTMFAEFEQIVHEKAAAGEPLTPDVLTDVYYDLNIKYFGDDIQIDKDIGMEWARIPHFYMNYYVYQYATGYSAATALSKQILSEGEPAVRRYKDFLKSGCSDYPINILQKAGVDMTSSEPIKQSLDVFSDVLSEMEALLAEQD